MFRMCLSDTVRGGKKMSGKPGGRSTKRFSYYETQKPPQSPAAVFCHFKYSRIRQIR